MSSATISRPATTAIVIVTPASARAGVSSARPRAVSLTGSVMSFVFPSLPVPNRGSRICDVPEALYFTDDDAANAGMDPGALEAAFREKPAIHRFPGNMARRVQELCTTIVSEYGGDAARVWTDAKDDADLRARIGSLPGFGEMKIKALGSVLAKRFDVPAAQGLVPNHPTLGDVDSREALERYQAAKREYKARLRASG